MYDDNSSGLIPLLIIVGIITCIYFVMISSPEIGSMSNRESASELAPVTATTPETSAPAPVVSGTITGTVTGKVKGTITGTITGTVTDTATDTATTVEPQEN